MQQDKLTPLINYLLKERDDLGSVQIPDDPKQRFDLYRSLVNIRPPMSADEDFLKSEEEYLSSLTQSKGITDAVGLPELEPGISLWQGDITTLKCGAIVNAANSGMTGCYRPCHGCIDNCIHTFAGVRLRYKCGEIMDKQGHEEPTGSAKLTPAYALPCDYVLHTVGPIVDGPLTDEHRRLLRSCYTSCLDLAEQNGIESVAFCCISTGVFCFPNDEAARIAVGTVREYLRSAKIIKHIIFCVYKDTDLEIYRSLLE